MEDEFFEGKRVLVTGGSRGIGATIVKLFARKGAKVVIGDIDKEAMDIIHQDLSRQGLKVFEYHLDVSDFNSVELMAEYIEKTMGGVDILVNNAGILRRTRFENISTREWHDVLDVNLNGVFFCCKVFYPGMKKRKFGRIINISSSAGRSVSTLGGAHYTVSKAGVLGLTRALAKEAAPFGVTVNAVCPGLIDTEMARSFAKADEIEGYIKSFPIQRLGTPEEVAELVLFLASDKASYITGASLDINGGDLMI